VFWDVFKSTRLDALKLREARDGGEASNNAKRERITHTQHLAPKMPRSYTSDTPKEAKMAALAQVGGGLLGVRTGRAAGAGWLAAGAQQQ
jgi:hypothetical protein